MYYALIFVVCENWEKKHITFWVKNLQTIFIFLFFLFFFFRKNFFFLIFVLPYTKSIFEKKYQWNPLWNKVFRVLMNVEICQAKIHFRNFCSILIKLAQKMRYMLMNTSCRFHQIPLINKDFFSIRQSIDFTIEAET